MGSQLEDDQWALIAPLLPRRNQRGRPRADDRSLLESILWILRSGARWKDLPRRYGTSSTCHRRLQEWEAQGVWDQIWLTFLSTLDQQAKRTWARDAEHLLNRVLRKVLSHTVCLWLNRQRGHEACLQLEALMVH